MTTKLFYVIEDSSLDMDEENLQSYLSTQKEPWLESLRYNLDVAVEYEDMTEEESDATFDRIKSNNSIEEWVEVNGFYYSIEEIVVVYQDNNILIRFNELENTYMLYEFNVDTYEFKQLISESKVKEYINND